MLDPREREEYLARAVGFPFPTRVLVRGLDLKANPASIPVLTSLYGKLGAAHRAGAVADLRAMIVEKLGNNSRPESQAALRELYQSSPDERDMIARALAAHPAEESLHPSWWPRHRLPRFEHDQPGCAWPRPDQGKPQRSRGTRRVAAAGAPQRTEHGRRTQPASEPVDRHAGSRRYRRFRANPARLGAYLRPAIPQRPGDCQTRPIG